MGAFIKGQPNTLGGRPKGSVSASTLNARRAIADFVDDNVDRLTGWLDAMAEKDPKAAFDAFMSVVEYHIPKLARSDNTETKVNVNLNLFAQESAMRDKLVAEAQRLANADAAALDTVMIGAKAKIAPDDGG